MLGGGPNGSAGSRCPSARAAAETTSSAPTSVRPASAVSAFAASRTVTSARWLATPAALIMLAIAAIVEILAYYVPGVDNLLDTLATPAAVVAGTLVSAAVITDLPPMLKWTTAIIAGGGVAGLTQGVTALLRAKSTVLTAGVGNPVIATAELGGSLLVSLLALAAPLIALLVVIVFLWLAMRLIRRIARSASSSSTG